MGSLRNWYKSITTSTLSNYASLVLFSDQPARDMPWNFSWRVFTVGSCIVSRYFHRCWWQMFLVPLQTPSSVDHLQTSKQRVAERTYKAVVSGNHWMGSDVHPKPLGLRYVVTFALVLVFSPSLVLEELASAVFNHHDRSRSTKWGNLRGLAPTFRL